MRVDPGRGKLQADNEERQTSLAEWKLEYNIANRTNTPQPTLRARPKVTRRRTAVTIHSLQNHQGRREIQHEVSLGHLLLDMYSC